MSNPLSLSNPTKALGSESPVGLRQPDPEAPDAGQGIATPFDGRPRAAELGRESARRPASGGAVSAALPPSSPSFPALHPGVGSTAFLVQRIVQETIAEANLSVEARRGVPARSLRPNFLGLAGIDIEA